MTTEKKAIHAGRLGAAAELFVAVTLLLQGIEVTKPLNTNTKDDLHARFADGWRNIQVRPGRVSSKGRIWTHWRRTGKGRITSDLVAFVDLRGLRIRWACNRRVGLPKELK
jgi:hypothetical protein